MFTITLMAEKAIKLLNYSIMLLMMDISKAFESIHGAFILEDLRSILLPEDNQDGDRWCMALKIENDIRYIFSKNIGTPQEDCIHRLLFTLYL